MTSAFRQLGIRREDWFLLIMKCEHPVTGKIWYFIDKCLPFGAAISCAHFQELSNVIAHLVRYKTNSDLVNYLDDYLFAALLKSWCNKQMEIFLGICEQINFPVSHEKTFWSTTQLVFLGLLLDTVAQVVMIPVEKIQVAISLISSILSKKKGKITLKQLQEICGFLNFLCRAVVPGRAFTRCLYMYTGSRAGKKLQPHHHIKIDYAMREDLLMWLKFLNHLTCYSRPFKDFEKCWHATEIVMYPDASRNPQLGFGGICNHSWMYGKWNADFILEAEPSISYLELFAVVAMVINWLERFKNKRIILFCDNQSVVSMINNTTASCVNCLHLIRILVFHSLVQNTRVFAKYVPSKSNKASDCLSRLQLNKFQNLSDSWDNQPTPIPDEIWPMEKLWIKYKVFYLADQARKAKSLVSTSHISSSDSSRISRLDMNRILEKLKCTQIRDSTKRNYKAVWKLFNQFLIRLDEWPSAWEDRVSLFGAYMVEQQGIQSSTLKSYVSAIKHLLLLDGYDWNDDKVLLTVLVRASKLVNDKLHMCMPIKLG